MRRYAHTQHKSFFMLLLCIAAQVMLQNMYESYYQAEPAQRTPPIPTTQVKTQQSAERERELCYLAATTASEREAVKQCLLKAVLELEHLVRPGHPVRSMVEGGSSAWMGQYIIKREFSEGSRHVFGVSLPDLSSARPAAHADPGQHISGNVDGEVDVCLSDVADGRPQESSGGQAGASILASVKAAVSTVARILGMSAAPGQKLPSSQQHTVADLPLEVQPPDISPDAPICRSPDAAAAETESSSAVHASNVQGGARGSVGMKLTPELDSMLDETADRLLQTSCGEGWLVQPRIANMSGLEYRVYMLGGASAVSLSSMLSIQSVLSTAHIFLKIPAEHMECLALPAQSYVARQSPLPKVYSKAARMFEPDLHSCIAFGTADQCMLCSLHAAALLHHLLCQGLPLRD